MNLTQRPWRAHTASVQEFPPTMLSPEELNLLHWLTSSYYRGEGAIIDGGCFLGGSTYALASGLGDRPGVIHSYDIFSTAPPMWFSKLADFGLAPNQNFESQYRHNISAYSNRVHVHSGDLLAEKWTGEAIEILFLDVCKTPDLQDYTTRVWFPHLIPGRSIVIQQDYGWRYAHWTNVMMEVFKEHFQILDDVPSSSRVYLCTSQVNDTETRLFATLPDQQKLAHMSAAVASVGRSSVRIKLLYNQALLADELGCRDIAKAALRDLLKEPDIHQTIPVAIRKFPSYFNGTDALALPVVQRSYLRVIHRELRRIGRQLTFAGRS